MIRFKILLNTDNKIKKYFTIINTFDYDIDIYKGHNAIDGRSSMGMFTLNLNKPIMVQIHTNNKDIINKFNEVMEW